ncbi:hypothetical protein RRG08_024359 [Elysia crispata]|uniref:Uncharacterized protein n=1 Tax=Elysia crispata TaxID=231223 RepID=A0AAE0ZLA7_9GAST|nr:hypothetical protein RRG08_024359 [Elysia crispata]
MEKRVCRSQKTGNQKLALQLRRSVLSRKKVRGSVEFYYNSQLDDQATSVLMHLVMNDKIGRLRGHGAYTFISEWHGDRLWRLGIQAGEGTALRRLRAGDTRAPPHEDLSTPIIYAPPPPLLCPKKTVS